MHAAGLTAMAADHSLRWRPEALAQINAPILEALTSPDFVHHAESRNPEVGLWGLVDWNAATDSLPDRVETSIVPFLFKKPGAALRDIETTLNAELPGLLTPSLGLVHAVLASYAIEKDGGWSLRPEDAPLMRRDDLETASRTLTAMAPRLGFTFQRQEGPHRLILWQESGDTVYAFYLLASAVAGQILRQNPFPRNCSVLVLPGGRAGLFSYKLEADPALRSLADGWRIVKFRTLRSLSGVTDLTREVFDKELSGDPIEPPEQMKLF
jgi:hypothetical protein